MTPWKPCSHMAGVSEGKSRHDRSRTSCATCVRPTPSRSRPSGVRVPAYRVDSHPDVERVLRRLTNALRERVAERALALGADPRPPGSLKLSGHEAYRIRVGAYRIVYEVDDKA